MRTIRISDEVWDAIAQRGKFGETEDDVLRRVFEIVRRTPLVGQSINEASAIRPTRTQHANRRMHAGVHNEALLVSFHDGKERRWPLPARSNKEEIRKIREEAVKFALENGASDPGQTNAVRKALTNEGYHL